MSRAPLKARIEARTVTSMKRCGEPVDVAVGGDDLDEAVPTGFRWRGADFEIVDVLGHWREDGAWWSGGGIAIPQRDLWRIAARRRGRSRHATVVELVCEQGRWRLARVWD